MPNFHTDSFEALSYPCTQGDTTFLWEAFSSRGNRLVFASLHDVTLMIRICAKKEGGWLIKGDKITRPTKAVLLQKALQDFKEVSHAEVHTSNIESKQSLHVKMHSPYLKSIEFFASEAFEKNKEVWIEVGFGSGRHLLHQAKKHPHIHFIGLEIHKPSIAQVLKQCELQGIENISVLDYDARLFMEFLPSNSVGRIFVHFPVPWDKKPHRRVFSQGFIEEALRVLYVKGTLELRTDSELYFEFALSVMLHLSKVDVHIYKNALLEISSKYEDRWRKMDKDIYDVILCNEIDSPDKAPIQRLWFDTPFDFQAIKKRFKAENYLKEGFFVHFEELFCIGAEEKSGLIRLSFGANERNEKAYIWIKEDGQAFYMPNAILATKSNSAAHTFIKGWFDGICD